MKPSNEECLFYEFSSSILSSTFWWMPPYQLALNAMFMATKWLPKVLTSAVFIAISWRAVNSSFPLKTKAECVAISFKTVESCPLSSAGNEMFILIKCFEHLFTKKIKYSNRISWNLYCPERNLKQAFIYLKDI